MGHHPTSTPIHRFGSNPPICGEAERSARSGNTWLNPPNHQSKHQEMEEKKKGVQLQALQIPVPTLRCSFASWGLLAVRAFGLTSQSSSPSSLPSATYGSIRNNRAPPRAPPGRQILTQTGGRQCLKQKPENNTGETGPWQIPNRQKKTKTGDVQTPFLKKTGNKTDGVSLFLCCL